MRPACPRQVRNIQIYSAYTTFPSVPHGPLVRTFFILRSVCFHNSGSLFSGSVRSFGSFLRFGVRSSWDFRLFEIFSSFLCLLVVSAFRSSFFDFSVFFSLLLLFISKLLYTQYLLINCYVTCNVSYCMNSIDCSSSTIMHHPLTTLPCLIHCCEHLLSCTDMNKTISIE